MKGLAMMLKGLGINISPEHIKAAEEIIPQLPARLNQAVVIINGAINNFDQRLQALEKQNAEILEILRSQNGTGRNRTEFTASRNGTGD